jgi:hypothetical protein
VSFLIIFCTLVGINLKRMKKNNIEISSDSLSLVFKSLLIALAVIYLFNHTGKFYTEYENYLPSNTVALTSFGTATSETTVILSYKSPFGTKIIYPTKFKYKDTWSSNEGINAYTVKAECYLMALFKDFIYVIMITVLIASAGYFFSKNKISLK